MAGLTFGQLPDEEPAFLAYLQTTGDIWARAVHDEALTPRFAPLPVAEFLKRYAAEVKQYDVVDIYLGQRDPIQQPVLVRMEVSEGGAKVQRDFLAATANPYVRYKRGEFRSAEVIASSNLGYPAKGQLAPEFLKWAANVVNWMRRRTPELVPVFQCNYETRATVKLAAACREGLKLGI